MAEWFEYHLGVVVPEVGFDRLETPQQTTRLFKHWRTPDRCRQILTDRIAEARGEPGLCCDVHGDVRKAEQVGQTEDGWPVFVPIENMFPLFHVASHDGMWAAVTGPRPEAKARKAAAGPKGRGRQSRQDVEKAIQQTLNSLDDFFMF